MYINNSLRAIFSLVLTLFFLGCGSRATSYQSLPTFNDDGSINVVIEIPAGTNQKIEFNVRKNSFEQDEIDGQPRQINFLPYPANYGFIPGTVLAASQGGDGDAMDVLVIAESLSTGTTLEAKPIGILLLEDNGEKDHKVIAIPSDPGLQIIQVDNFMDFITQHDAVKQIIETWFLNYKGFGNMKFIKWEDEQFALEAINRISTSR